MLFRSTKNVEDEFYATYYNHVIINENDEYLTEKQVENGPILVDFDFRYDGQTERKHNGDHITDVMCLYADILKDAFIQFQEGDEFTIYAMEKPNVNYLENKNITKDGIHLLFTVRMNHYAQQLLRLVMIDKIEDVFSKEEFDFANNWDSILDEGISKEIGRAHV